MKLSHLDDIVYIFWILKFFFENDSQIQTICGYNYSLIKNQLDYESVQDILTRKTEPLIILWSKSTLSLQY